MANKFSEYESTSAELPQLRVGLAKHRSLQAIKKELEQTLKQKEAVILSLIDQNKNYNQLNKDKSLAPLRLIDDNLNRIQREMHEKDNELELLTRKSQIAIETLKEETQTGQIESQKLENRLENICLELSNLRKRAELCLNEKFIGIYCPGAKPQHDSEYSLNNPAEESMDCMLSSRSWKIGTPKLELSPRRTGTIKELGDSTPRSACTIASSDRGDGDGAVLNETESYNQQNKLPPEEPQSSSQAECSDDLKDTNDMDDDATTGAEIITNGTNEDIGNEMQMYDDNAESKNTGDVSEYQNKIPVPSKLHSARTEKVSNIPKQFSAEFKEREVIPGSFCRQATNNALSEEPQKPNIVDKSRVAPGNCKKKLLGAPKSIDDKNPWNKTT